MTKDFLALLGGLEQDILQTGGQLYVDYDVYVNLQNALVTLILVSSALKWTEIM
jgi:hypothetical protein